MNFPAILQRPTDIDSRRMTWGEQQNGVTARAKAGEVTMVAADVDEGLVYTASGPSNPAAEADWLKRLNLPKAALAIARDGGEATANGAQARAEATGRSLAQATGKAALAIASSPGGSGTQVATALASLGATAEAYSLSASARASASATQAGSKAIAHADGDLSYATAATNPIERQPSDLLGDKLSKTIVGAWLDGEHDGFVGDVGMLLGDTLLTHAPAPRLTAEAVAHDGAHVLATARKGDVHIQGSGESTEVDADNHSLTPVSGSFINWGDNTWHDGTNGDLKGWQSNPGTPPEKD